MLRTDTVQLTVIPASAYRQKLTSGGSGIVIIRKDTAQPGIASVSRKTGKAVPAVNTQKELYPEEAFAEALALTNGLPYRKQKAVKKEVPAEEPDPALESLAESEEYRKITEKYTDKSGKLSYELLNKDLIRFSRSSSIVREMIAEQKPVKKIREYIIGVKFRNVAENHDLTDAQVMKIAELLDEAYPKGVFKTLNDTLRKDLAAQKKK